MKIMKIKGIEVKLHVSTLVIIGMVGFSLGQWLFALTGGSAGWGQLIFAGVVGGLVFLFSIVLHELCHSLVALRYGIEIDEIELYLFGGVSKIKGEPTNPRQESIISVVGPLSSLALGGLLILAFFLVAPVSFIGGVMLDYLGWANIFLGGFNLLPAFPMDGGRLLRAGLWKRRNDKLSATKTASRAGEVIGIIFVGLGFLEVFLVGIVGGIWLVLIGLFLRNSAANAYEQARIMNQFEGIRVGDLVNEFSTQIPPDMSISEAFSGFFMRQKKQFFPVGTNGSISGVLVLEDVKDIPPGQRPEKKTSDVMRTVDSFNTVSIDDSGDEVLTEINHMDSKPRMVLVKDSNDELVGYVGVAEMQFFMRVAS